LLSAFIAEGAGGVGRAVARSSTGASLLCDLGGSTLSIGLISFWGASKVMLCSTIGGKGFSTCRLSISGNTLFPGIASPLSSDSWCATTFACGFFITIFFLTTTTFFFSIRDSSSGFP
jgi:hypothetical protein